MKGCFQKILTRLNFHKANINFSWINSKDNKLKPEIAVSNRAKDPTVSYPLIPKRSFFIYSNNLKDGYKNVRKNLEKKMKLDEIYLNPKNLKDCIL